MANTFEVVKTNGPRVIADGGNGIDDEENIGRVDRRENQSTRRSVQFSVPAQEQPRPFRARRHRQPSSQSPSDKAWFWLDRALRGKHHPYAGESERCRTRSRPNRTGAFSAENDEASRKISAPRSIPTGEHLGTGIRRQAQEG